MRPLLAMMLLLSLAGSATAERAACAGTSLLPTIQRDRPQVWSAAMEEFQAVPNGAGLLWRIERNGSPPSWLFGTMHVPEAEAEEIKAQVATAFESASALVVESSEVLAAGDDPDFMQQQLAKSVLPEGETVDTTFSPAEKDALGRLTAAHGIPYFVARRMQPWFLAAALAVPPCVKLAILGGEPVVDQRLHHEALAANKEVIGLETAEEQFAAMASLDNAVQIAALLEAAEIGLERSEDLYATMLDLYRQQRVALLPILLSRMPEYRRTARSVDDMSDPLINARNHRMRDRLLPHIERGGAFIAVGALHLGGTDGLVTLLEQRGLQVTRVE